MIKLACAECGTRAHRPKPGWNRIFCTADCMGRWSRKHYAIVRGYALAGM